ncbi:MAG: hypothetical protein FJ023_06140 [Chloroflexi bacterium]|nr:hypothetical protein [Chloroflexota bacterium]
MRKEGKYTRLFRGLAVTVILSLLLSMGLATTAPRPVSAGNESFWGWHLDDRTGGYPGWLGDWTGGGPWT